MEVDGLNGNGLKERCLFTAETLRLSDVSAFRRQFRASPLFFSAVTTGEESLT